MSKKLSELVIMSDIDGTLLNREGAIPERNIKALERFTAAGGRFGVATGRSLGITRPVVELLPMLNFPCVVYNGGALDDFEREEYLYQLFLPKEMGEYFTKIRKVFPDCGVVLAGDSYVDVDASIRTNQSWWFDRYPRGHVLPVKIDDITWPAYKALFVLPHEQCEQLYKYVCEHEADFEEVRFVFSDATMFEMLPKGSSKGSAIEKLMAITGVKWENIAAIGDYYNDIEMLTYAGISAAPADSLEDIKSAADLVVCPCGQGAVADLVEHLEAQYGS